MFAILASCYADSDCPSATPYCFKKSCYGKYKLEWPLISMNFSYRLTNGLLTTQNLLCVSVCKNEIPESCWVEEGRDCRHFYPYCDDEWSRLPGEVYPHVHCAPGTPGKVKDTCHLSCSEECRNGGS